LPASAAAWGSAEMKKHQDLGLIAWDDALLCIIFLFLAWGGMIK
jgi:hypothetical protein